MREEARLVNVTGSQDLDEAGSLIMDQSAFQDMVQ
jgi:hypothetical protein